MATKTRPAIIPITEIEHAAFCKTEDELPSKSLAEELAVNIRWQKIPDEYLHYPAWGFAGVALPALPRPGASLSYDFI